MRRLLVVVAVVAVAATACGDDDGSASAPDVVIRDLAYDPGSAEVEPGGTLRWHNEDDVAHTVTAGTSTSPSDAFAESVDAGATVELTFDEPGTYPYFCAIHPAMTGEVVVG